MSWNYFSFSEVVKDITGGNVKFQSNEYNSFGQFPIIDQGASEIAGYTDKEEVVKRKKDVILFGDHTKCLKYVDFDFCLGADGVKVLQPIDELDTKFLYFYLRTIILPDVGYSRHFKFLKEIQIPLPPLATQQRIAAILDTADALRRKDQELLQKYDALAQAIFIDMFGDPVKNEKGFNIERLGECLNRIQIGPFGTQLHESDYITNGIPIINPMHIGELKIKPNYKYSITEKKYQELPQYHLKEDDVILGRRGEMGRCALVTKSESGFLCGTGSLFLTVSKEKLEPVFLVYLLSREKIKKELEKSASGTTMANLNKTIVEDFKIIVPSIKTQRIFKDSILINQLNIELIRNNLNKSENLFQTLLQKSFKAASE